jgi:hypothetical protein
MIICNYQKIIIYEKLIIEGNSDENRTEWSLGIKLYPTSSSHSRQKHSKEADFL